MLIYHPAQDLNHGMFRLLNVMEASPIKAMPFDMFRILDLYYLFPYLLVKARLPRTLTSKKKRYENFESKYSNVPSPHLFIQQIRGIHEIIARSLSSKGFLDPSALENATISRTDQPLPSGIRTLIESQAEEERELVRMLAEDLTQLPLLGPDGLKARTGLLEFRYDPA